MPTQTERDREQQKYVEIYGRMPDYRMGGPRMLDATDDLRWARALGCNTYLDVGCGRGEMLEVARRLGFGICEGTEYVPDLCDGATILNRAINDLHEFADQSYDVVTSFDVIEHVHPGDDELLIVEIGRIAKTCMAWTANNRASVDPATGADLHINKREYDVWDQMFRDLLEPDWKVERMRGKRYVSETWRATR